MRTSGVGFSTKFCGKTELVLRSRGANFFAQFSGEPVVGGESTEQEERRRIREEEQEEIRRIRGGEEKKGMEEVEDYRMCWATIRMKCICALVLHRQPTPFTHRQHAQPTHLMRMAAQQILCPQGIVSAYKLLYTIRFRVILHT